jgi:hypothetical protein
MKPKALLGNAENPQQPDDVLDKNAARTGEFLVLYLLL